MTHYKWRGSGRGATKKMRMRKRVSQLERGDIIRTKDGGWVIVSYVTEECRETQTYSVWSQQNVKIGTYHRDFRFDVGMQSIAFRR